MKISFYFRPSAFWLGLDIDRPNRTLLVGLMPMVGLRIVFESLCFPRRHQWSGWTENLGDHAVASRYRQCQRCLKVEIGQ